MIQDNKDPDRDAEGNPTVLHERELVVVDVQDAEGNPTVLHVGELAKEVVGKIGVEATASEVRRSQPQWQSAHNLLWRFEWK